MEKHTRAAPRVDADYGKKGETGEENPLQEHHFGIKVVSRAGEMAQD